MYNIAYNKALGINENDVLACNDLDKLNEWRIFIKKERDELAVSMSKMKREFDASRQLSQQFVDKYHVLQLKDKSQLTLAQQINYRIGILKENRQKTIGERFMKHAEIILPEDKFNELMDLATFEF